MTDPDDETIAIQADSELLQMIGAGLTELRAGDVMDEDELAEHLRRAGRYEQPTAVTYHS